MESIKKVSFLSRNKLVLIKYKGSTIAVGGEACF
jgi:hypothetical protein